MAQIKSLNELKDSRILYDKKIPFFGYMIVGIVFLLLIAALIWSIVTPKVYIVKGNGVVESTNKNYIMSGYSGEISEISVKNGDYATEGDVLLTIKSTDLNLQKVQIDSKIRIYEQQIAQLKKLEQSIVEDKNLFSASVSEDKLYYDQFEVYKAQIAQNTMDLSQYKNYGYTDEQIELEVQKNSAKISEIYYSTLKSIGESITSTNAELESAKAQSDAITAGQQEYTLKAATSGIVYLNADYKKGMVIQAGSVMGSVANENDSYIVKTMISANDLPRVEMGDEADISVLGLMESVYGTIPGKITRIDSDITAQQSQDGSSENGSSYFRLDIEPKNTYLISKSGKKFNVTNGTTVETRIKYDEVSYFEYLLESLGILVR